MEQKLRSEEPAKSLASSSRLRRQAREDSMIAPTRPRRWREVERRPVPGNSPNDRILRGPDCNRPKRVYADSFPTTPWPEFPEAQRISGRRFLRHAESIGPMCSLNPRPESRLPLVGPRSPVKERDGRNAFCSSAAMSSDRLFLDRVARQHCPSPLHRHAQTITHPQPALAKQDISPEVPSRVRQLADKLARAQPMRRGSLSDRTIRCGKAGCACADNPKARHGPYHSLTQAVGGKTRSRFLSEEQAAVARQQIAAGREFRGHVDAYWEACEQWADAQLEPAPTAPSEEAEKRGSKRNFKPTSSRKSKRS